MWFPLDLVIISWRAFSLFLAIVDLLVFVLLGRRTVQLTLLVLMGRVCTFLIESGNLSSGLFYGKSAWWKSPCSIAIIL